MTNVTTTEAPHADARATIAAGLMFLFRILPTVLGVRFVLADTAVTIWLIATGHWGWLILSVVLIVPIMTVATYVVTLLAMPLFFVARLFDRETAELLLDRLDD
jgi:uncharacterized membrane protein